MDVLLDDQTPLQEKEGSDTDFDRNDYNDEIPVLSVDEVIENVGGCGIYQVVICLIFSFACIPMTYQILIMYFTGHSPGWKCSNGTNKWCNFTGEVTSADLAFHKRCSMPRQSWEYVTAKSYSIITEYDLVCDKNSLAAFANSALYIGWGIGCIPLGIAADYFGRKIVMFASGATILSCVLASAFVTAVWQFVILRAIIGLGITGYGLSAYVLASEIVGTKFRSTIGNTIFLFGTGGLLLLTFQAYHIQNWRHLTVICSAPYFAFAAAYLCIPESPRWLSSQGKIAKALKVLATVAKVNRKPLPNNQIEQSSKIRKSQGSFKNLFKPKRRLIITASLSFGWMVAGMTYYGISLASADLSGNMYRDFAFTSVVEVPATMLSVPFLEKFGRKKTAMMSMLLTGLFCCSISFFPEKSSIKIYPVLRIIGGMAGKFFITLAFNAYYVWSIELHPTAIRTQGMSFASLLARVGSTSAPFIANVLKEIHPALPFLVMGIMALAAGIVGLQLPETVGRNTMESIDDLQTVGKDISMQNRRDTSEEMDLSEEDDGEWSEDELNDSNDKDALIRRPLPRQKITAVT